MVPSKCWGSNWKYEYIDEAKRLIKKGKKPWLKDK
jgi:hypothetical protein